MKIRFVNTTTDNNIFIKIVTCLAQQKMFSEKVNVGLKHQNGEMYQGNVGLEMSLEDYLEERFDVDYHNLAYEVELPSGITNKTAPRNEIIENTQERLENADLESLVEEEQVDELKNGVMELYDQWFHEAEALDRYWGKTMEDEIRDQNLENIHRGTGVNSLQFDTKGNPKKYLVKTWFTEEVREFYDEEEFRERIRETVQDLNPNENYEVDVLVNIDNEGAREARSAFLERFEEEFNTDPQ